MPPSNVEQRYWTHQLWGSVGSLMVLLSMVPITFLLTPGGGERGARPLEPAEVGALGLTLGLMVIALALHRWSVRRWSHREMRDERNRARVHDEHEQTIRLRGAQRALTSVVVLQTALYCWATFASASALPLLPPGLAAIVTLVVAHLAFWLPYLRDTRPA